MTADHAGQTGGERDPHWIKDRFELDGDDDGEREVCARCGHVDFAHNAQACVRTGCYCNIGYWQGRWVTKVDRLARRLEWFTDDELAAELARRRPVPVAEKPCEHPDVWFDRVSCAEPCGGMHHRCVECGEATDGCPNEVVPVAGQAAREAAVEAVARRLSADYDTDRSWVTRDDTYREAWREDARELLSLPEVAALSAAPAIDSRMTGHHDGAGYQTGAAPGREH